MSWKAQARGKISDPENCRSTFLKTVRYQEQTDTKASMESTLDSKEMMSRFLAEVERRAFQMAKFATRNRDEALDLVQETMLQFVRRYSIRPQQEWKALFYRVLRSRITDWYRRNLVRRKILAWLGRPEEEDPEDPLQSLPDTGNPNPSDHVLRQEQRGVLEKAIRDLPLRQQQAFLLRAWEGMDLKQTAFVMKCSEGSVKTHYSRAVHTLRGLLEGLRS
jgi:RNA polymerase sigma-70 factor (ECF subfamily)